MRLVMSHDLFAAKGDEWNRPNFQHNADPVIRIGTRTGPTLTWKIEGYGPDGDPSRAPARAPEPSRAAPIARDWAGQRRSLWAEGEHYHAPEELRGKARPLSEDQLALRKRQRAAVKARLTRAGNQLAKREAARKAAVMTMAVKLSQWRF